VSAVSAVPGVLGRCLYQEAVRAFLAMSAMPDPVGAWAGVAVARTSTGVRVRAPTMAPPVSLTLRVMLLTALLDRDDSFFQTPTGLADGFGLEVALRHVRPAETGP
jgi:hypothetical protein